MIGVGLLVKKFFFPLQTVMHTGTHAHRELAQIVLIIDQRTKDHELCMRKKKKRYIYIFFFIQIETI